MDTYNTPSGMSQPMPPERPKWQRYIGFIGLGLLIASVASIYIWSDIMLILLGAGIVLCFIGLFFKPRWPAVLGCGFATLVIGFIAIIAFAVGQWHAPTRDCEDELLFDSLAVDSVDLDVVPLDTVAVEQN